MSAESNAPIPRKGAPKHQPPDRGEEIRVAMKVWAEWAIKNRAQFTYTEGGSRWHMVESPPGSLPQFADCSSFVTGLAKWAGAKPPTGDPNGLMFKGGYTGTMLKHCNRIGVSQVRMGDAIIYGPGTGSHAVFVMERLPGNDFWVASHGHQGDPSRVLHSHFMSYFGGSARYLRWLS